MKRAAILATLLVAGAARAGEDAATKVFARASASVATVFALDEKGKLEGQGSGIAIASNRLVTNCHVVRDAHGLKVRHGKVEREARWLRADLQRDLCVLEVAGLDMIPARLRKSSDLAIGEQVFAVGNPLGFDLSVSEGLISALSPAGGETRIFTSAALSPGSSGGGMFDMEGRLVGITTAILNLGQNLNVVLPADWIGEMDSRAAPPPAKPELPPAERNWQREAKQLEDKSDWGALETLAREWTQAVGSPPSWSTLGVAQANLGKHAEAEVSHRSALQLFERDANAMANLADALAARNQMEEAERLFHEAMRANPLDGYSRYQLARLRMNQSRLDEARRSALEAVRLSPGYSKGWNLLGQIEERRNDPAAAAHAYRVASRQEPDNAQYAASLARSLAASGRGDEARNVLSESPAAPKMDAAAWINLGYEESRKLRWSDAEQAFRKAIEVDSNSVKAWLNLASVQLRTERSAEAEISVTQALAIAPDHPGAVTLRGEIQLKANRVAEAQQTFERALALDPRQPVALRFLGRIRIAARNDAGAVELLRRLVELPEGVLDDWLQLGNAYARLSRLDEAESALRKADQLAPDNTDVLLALASLYGRRGDNLGALDFTRRLINLDPGSANVWSNHGYALTRLGRYREGQSALETAVNLEPDSSNAWINLGHNLLLQKQLGKAIQALEKGTHLAPAAMDAQLYLGQAYLGSRQYLRARTVADRMLAQQPGAPAALGLSVLVNLAEGRTGDAHAAYQQLRMRNAPGAATLRRQAIASGVPGASALPE